jgi:hypothetical protein
MKYIFFLFVVFDLSLSGQELRLKSATMQTINQGASAVSSTTYRIRLEKSRKYKWSVDSIIGIQSGQPVDFQIMKLGDDTVLKPGSQLLREFKKTDKGLFEIVFGIQKSRGNGRPNAPQNMKVDTTNIDGGVYIYYRTKCRKKKIKVDTFEVLETLDAP